MTIKIGRVTLSDPHDIDIVSRRSIETVQGPGGYSTPLDGSRSTRGYRLNGTVKGAAAQDTADDWELEQGRLGSVYVAPGTNKIPEGWYELEDPVYKQPRGAPNQRPWSCTLWQAPHPFVCRQAEDDNVVGADIVDLDAEEGVKVVYTPTTSEVIVLDPRNVSGAEKVNLPYGSWKMLARCYQVTNSSATLRWRTRDAAGAVLASGDPVVIGTADAWVYRDLGILTIAKANDKANWYTVEVQGTAGQLGDVWLDSILLVRQ